MSATFLTLENRGDLKRRKGGRLRHPRKINAHVGWRLHRFSAPASVKTANVERIHHSQLGNRRINNGIGDGSLTGVLH